MSKTVKGCLIVVIIFILVGIGSISLIIRNIDKSFLLDKNKVDVSWEKYTKLLSNRNYMLQSKSEMKNIIPFLNKTEKNLITHGSKKDLLTNEYVLNDSLRKYEYVNFTNQKLNGCLLNYNRNVKEFNAKYSSFPYNYLRIKKSVDLYDYFEIEYGADNSEIIKRNQKIDDWIKNGGNLKGN